MVLQIILLVVVPMGLATAEDAAYMLPDLVVG